MGMTIEGNKITPNENSTDIQIKSDLEAGRIKTTKVEAAGGFENDSNITESIVVESGKCKGLFGPVALSNTHIKLGGNMTVIGDFSVPDTGIFKVDDGGSFEVK